MSDANWYPDPEDPTQVRYWDGGQWTDHRSPVPTPEPAATAPQSFPPPVQQSFPPPVQQGFQSPPPQSFPPPAPAKKKSKALWILAIILVLLIIGIVSCFAVIGGAAKSVSDELNKNEASVVTPDPSGGSDGTETPATSSDGESAAGSRGAPLAIGTAVDLGNGWKVNVVSADVSADAQAAVLAANEFNDPPDPGMRYILVNLSATFAGTPEDSTESPMLGWSYSVFGSAAVERDSFDSFASPPEPQLDTLAELAAGGVASGNVVVAVGADETDLVLRVTPAFSFNDTEAWFALG